jgi:hypothetical protein
MRFAGLVADPMRSQQHLQTSLEGKSADLAPFLDDLDRPVSRHGGILLDQPLNNTGSEQHRVDIVFQRRTVMAVAINAVDRVAHMKSVKRHKLTMPKSAPTALTSIK